METVTRSLGTCFINMDLVSQFRSTELIQNMRQKDDSQYAEILSEIRLGNLNEAHLKILQDRIVVDSNGKPSLTEPSKIADYLIDLLDQEPETLCLVPTVEAMDAVNKRCLERLGLEKIEIPSYDQTRTQIRKGNQKSSVKKVNRGSVLYIVLICISIKKVF